MPRDDFSLSPQPLTVTSEPTVAAPRPSSHVEKTIVNIGKSVVIKGELSGSEDLIIEGQVDGKIELRQNVLTNGANGKIKAQVFAKAVIILGEVTGNVTASEKVDIRDNGSVDGDITSPRVAIASESAAGLVAAKLAGHIASSHCRTAKRARSLATPSSGAASTNPSR